MGGSSHIPLWLPQFGLSLHVRVRVCSLVGDELLDDLPGIRHGQCVAGMSGGLACILVWVGEVQGHEQHRGVWFGVRVRWRCTTVRCGTVWGQF